MILTGLLFILIAFILENLRIRICAVNIEFAQRGKWAIEVAKWLGIVMFVLGIIFFIGMVIATPFILISCL